MNGTAPGVDGAVKVSDAPGASVRIGCVPNCTVCTSGLGLANVTVPPAVTVPPGGVHWRMN